MSTEGVWDCFGMSDLGKRRGTNEDRFLVAEIGRRLSVEHTNITLRDGRRHFAVPQGYLLIIADGLGGHPGGEYASETVVGAVAGHVLSAMPCLSHTGDRLDCGVGKELIEALGKCHIELQEFARKHPDYERLGTTLTVALVLWPYMYVLHVGDSRCYILRDGKLIKVTTDDTIAQQLVDAGALTPDKAARTRWAHVLANVVDTRENYLPPQTIEVQLSPGDTILLCTDGLTGSVNDDGLIKAMTASETSQAACEALVQAANGAGGHDNITTIVARVVGTE